MNQSHLVKTVGPEAAELPGIFNWSLDGWRQLQLRGRFIEPRVCREELSEFRTNSNPARAFLLEAVRSMRGHQFPARSCTGGIAIGATTTATSRFPIPTSERTCSARFRA